MAEKINEDKWRAEDDARTIMEAKIIQGNPKRLSRAIDAAKELSEKKMDEARSMKKVAVLIKPKIIRVKK